jgi:xylulokinase
MQGDVFGTEITTINSSEGPALGVALLAGVGAGIYSSVPEACDSVIKVVTNQSPDMNANSRYNKVYSIYKNLYKSLSNDFKDLSDILKSN